MRFLCQLSVLLLVCASVCQAQPDEDRSAVVYFVGQIEKCEGTTCQIDLGEAHTIKPQDRLAVFRSTYNYFQALGAITVEHTEATVAVCSSPVAVKPGDLVMTVRELQELQRGAAHRRRVLRQRLIRTSGRPFSSNFRNMTLANALGEYEQQFPYWESSRHAVAGVFRSESLQRADTDQLKRLQTQVDLMRYLYRVSLQTVPAAGPQWNSAMQVLAGKSATAGRQRLIETAEKGAADGVAPDETQFSITDLRARVRKKLFHLQPEQQNVAALMVAAIVTGARKDSPTVLNRSFQQTQFPGLRADTELHRDIRDLVRQVSDTL